MMPSWWIPASCANALAPTTALLGATTAPVISVSMRLVGKSSSSRMPVVTPKLSLRTARATTTSSREAFPARSPIPLIVHSICRTPARIAASEFATAIPKSSWQCALSVIPCASPKYSDLGEHRSVLFRHRVSHSVRQVQDRRTCIHGHAAHLAKKAHVRPPRILGRELHFAHMLTSIANHRPDGFQRLLPGHLQLHAKMQIRRRQKNMQSRRSRRFQSLNGGTYVFFSRARERRNRHVANFLRHFLDRFQVSSRRDRKTCFNHVHIQRRKRPRQANLLRRVHRETRRLLAVTERGVKNAYDVHRVPQALVTHTSYPAVQFIFVLHLIISSYTSAGRICLGPRRIAGIPHGRERRQLFPRWRAPLPSPARHQPRYPQTRGLSWPASLRSWRAPCPPHRCGNPSEGLRRAPD